MRVMIIVKASQASETGAMPSAARVAAIDKFNEELVKAGVLLAAEGLYPSALGKRMRFCDSKRIVIDGPFEPTRELVSGYWLWQVTSIDEAVEWLKRCPYPSVDETEMEIRPVMEMTPRERASFQGFTSQSEFAG
jgi:hypothetical protein